MNGSPSRGGSAARALIALFLLAGGIATLVGTLRLARRFSERPTLRELRAEQRRMAAWPATNGVVEEMEVVKQDTGRGSGVLYSLRARYRYEVGGRRYTGSRLGLDWNVSGARNFDDFVARSRTLVPAFDPAPFRDSGRCDHLPTYADCSFAYPGGAPLVVHYDPADPAQSIVEKRELVPPSWARQIGSPLLWLAFTAALTATMFLSGAALLTSSGDAGRQPRQAILSHWALRGSAATLGILFCGLALEYYNENLGWRGALDDSEARFAWGVGLLVLGPIALLGLAMIFAPVGRLLDSAQRAVRQRR